MFLYFQFIFNACFMKSLVACLLKNSLTVGILKFLQTNLVFKGMADNNCSKAKGI